MMIKNRIFVLFCLVLQSLITTMVVVVVFHIFFLFDNFFSLRLINWLQNFFAKKKNPESFQGKFPELMLNTPTHLVFVDVERQKNKNGLSSSLLSTLVLIFLSFMVIVFLAKNNFPFNHITYKTINGNQIFIRFKVKDFLFSWRKFPGKKISMKIYE